MGTSVGVAHRYDVWLTTSTLDRPFMQTPCAPPSPVLLIANRGEIAIRIARAARELGWRTVGLVAQDEGHPLHAEHVDVAHTLPGRGVSAYLDIAQVLQAAKVHGCTHVHPGYGLLSENAAFARSCQAAGLSFVGPAPEVLDLLGDKAEARALATRCQVPVTLGLDRAVSLEEAQAFFLSMGGSAMMIKALAGGGGRGMRMVESFDEIAPSFERCQGEAQAAFGRADLYVEQLVRRARHIEVQVLGDGTGAASHVWERDCTVQRKHQKLIEIAPAPNLSPAVREPLLQAAVCMAQTVKLRGLCTFEFLLDLDSGHWFFMEANPRLQVEHTVTEQVTGLGLVQWQLRLSQGATLLELGAQCASTPSAWALMAQPCLLAAWCWPMSHPQALASAWTAMAMPACSPTRALTRCWPKSSCTTRKALRRPCSAPAEPWASSGSTASKTTSLLPRPCWPMRIFRPMP